MKRILVTCLIALAFTVGFLNLADTLVSNHNGTTLATDGYSPPPE